MISTTYTGELYDTTATTEVVSSDTSSGMGMDAFLKMFLAQVANQNPLDPMDNTEYTAQLAVFSQLEQLTNIAESVEGITDMTDAVNQNTIISYLGKEVTLYGNLLPLFDGYVGTVNFDLEESCYVSAVIKNEDGDTVSQIDLGYMEGGSQEFIWDGTTTAGADAEDGVYEIYLTGYDLLGNAVAASNITVSALVTGYTKDEEGGLYLLLGEAALPLSDVISVKQPSSGSGDGDTTSALEEWAESQSGTDGEDGISDFLESLATVGGLAAMLL